MVGSRRVQPDVMWGTDGGRVFTAEDGWVWTFAAVDAGHVYLQISR